jgi:hypothetical protein
MLADLGQAMARCNYFADRANTSTYARVAIVRAAMRASLIGVSRWEDVKKL